MLCCAQRVVGRRLGVRAASTAVRLQDYVPPSVDVANCELAFDVKDTEGQSTVLRTTFSVSRKPGTLAEALVLNGDPETVELVSVEANETALVEGSSYTLENDGQQLAIPMDTLFPDATDSSVVSITTRLTPKDNTSFMGLYHSTGGLFTQCEPQGFRRMTYFLDRPDVLTTYTTSITAPNDIPVLLSNGHQVETGPDPADPTGRRFATFHDPHPKPSYLFAVVCADLSVVSDSFVTQSGRKVDLHIFAKERDIHKCGAAMDALIASMKWDEDVFGLEYDLDVFNIVAVDDFNMGAMENKSLNVFNTKYVLASPDTSTDTDYDNVLRVVGHEYFHNWTGNRVTCRDWFQLSLKEGLTVYRDQEFSADMGSRAVKRISDVITLRSAQFAEDRGAMAHPVRPETYQAIDNFYTPTVYEKGAEVVRMMATILGRDGFRAGMDLYFQRHDGQAVTCEDFVAAMVDANKDSNPVVARDGLAQFMRWYSQAGTPTVTASQSYDADAGTMTVTLSQSNPPVGPYEEKDADKDALHIPIRMGILGPDGKALSMSDVSGGLVSTTSDDRAAVVHLTEPSQTFVFKVPTGLSTAPTLSLLQEFSAPVRLVQEEPAGADLHRLRHDTDAFNRWEASHRIAGSVVSDLYDSMVTTGGGCGGTSGSTGSTAHLTDALSMILQSEASRDPAWTALCLGLPGVEELLAGAISRHGSGNPLAMDAARSTVRRDLSLGLQESLLGLYTSLTDTCAAEATSLSKAAKANRALRNTVLSLLVEPHRRTHAEGTGDAGAASGVDVPELVLQHFQSAQNMTDAQAAVMLAAMLPRDHPVWEAVLVPFFEKWQDEPLVLDAWFRAQSLTGTAEDVEALLDHPSFTYHNPNRVYAGVVPFAYANPSAFHVESGKGYDVLANAVTVLNVSNPPVAARLAKAFGRASQLDDAFKHRVASALDPLLATDLKPEVAEVVSNARASLD